MLLVGYINVFGLIDSDILSYTSKLSNVGISFHPLSSGRSQTFWKIDINGSKSEVKSL